MSTEIVALLERSKIPAMTFLAAINSSQTTFDDVTETDSGLAFVTRVTDAPLQVAGLLGLDGVWRVSSYSMPTAPEHEDAAEVAAAKALDGDAFVLIDGQVAEAMIRFAIPKMLARLTFGEMREIFEQRLAQSRFAMPTIH
jgi:hypothetical protein